ncbi:2-Cys peroxiredoxin [Psychrosphaera saromensis]|uniref:Lipid hydroperoxide peroxidase n=1 Tax=Psychrosphaera saromensis TaxID=716813 RepID=A0A2S7UY89_9GAMM|nr:thiol peroxidase [Psychrosphaera saromensis]PQJ54957.1 lipid hydroperoxide peroxidase [Psychrosphaera saromensis]GHB55820.1 2-Cys peroxiredoxin [Psychrosphaera saromensis]GLQ13791.1 2-Cys peroxiredoxin [Psychrosphaera saromensis]
MKYSILILLTFLSTFSNAYDIQKGLPVHFDLVKAGDKPVALLGTQVNLGQSAPNFKVVDNKFSVKTLADFAGKPLLISVVSSLDTGICSIQTKRFNDEFANLPQDIVMLTISTDLPFAQKRFCQTENIDKMQTLSDSVWRDFGMNYGLLIKDMGLLARAIFVISPEGNIAYKEIVNRLSGQPDYDAALAAINAVSEQTEPTDVEEPTAKK